MTQKSSSIIQMFLFIMHYIDKNIHTANPKIVLRMHSQMPVVLLSIIELLFTNLAMQGRRTIQVGFFEWAVSRKKLS